MNVGSSIAQVPETTRSKSELRARSGKATAPWRQASDPFPGAHPARADLVQATRDARTALAAAVAATQRVRAVTAALEDALDLLAATVPAAPPPPARQREPMPLVDALSPREREVLALVAEGRSNKAIADALFVSPNTIKTHVASLLTKLRAETRVQLAVIAARQGTI